MKREEYIELYDKSINEKSDFWASCANTLVTWSTPFTVPFNQTLIHSKWFEDGKLNVCYNCLDRHPPSKTALIYDDNFGVAHTYTYGEVGVIVNNIASQLLKLGLKKNDVVAMYMTMCPESMFTMLACARLGIIHNVVFGGFSADSLIFRIKDSKAKLLVTQDVAFRGEGKIDFLGVAKQAAQCTGLGLFVFDFEHKDNSIGSLTNTRGPNDVHCTSPGFLCWSQVEIDPELHVPCVPVESEHPLFYLYTSGSTGRPKGIIHSTAGYLVYAALTTKVCFDVQDNDVFACTADVGWITSHTYSIYGPLSLGITTVIFGGSPTHPPTRLFEVVEKYRVTQLYTAPTVIRTLRKHFLSLSNKDPKENGDVSFVKTTAFKPTGVSLPIQPAKVDITDSAADAITSAAVNSINLSQYDLSSLRLLGSVGEPINKEAYLWFTEAFNNLPIVDTYWQTESGGVLVAPIPYVAVAEPECASLPMLGVEPVIASPLSTYTSVIVAEPYELGSVLFKGAWPGMARGVLNDPERFAHSYFAYTGYYYTGDEGYKDIEGRIWIRGRADDVINVSGHRLSTAEIESASCADPNISECAVVGMDDEITGQALCFFIVLATDMAKDEAVKSLKQTLRAKIGKLVVPRDVYVCRAIPKTATGKIMRRVLRDILVGNAPGDISTCVNVESIELLKQIGLGK